jgi:hypothetical protein
VTYTNWFTPNKYTGGESNFSEVRHWYMFSACGICVFFKAMLHHIKKCIDAAAHSKLQDEN